MKRLPSLRRSFFLMVASLAGILSAYPRRRPIRRNIPNSPSNPPRPMFH